MNKTTFKSKLHALYNRAIRITGSISFDHAVQSTLAAAGRYASVNLETFSANIFGYVQSDFADPKIQCPILRDETIDLMSTEGTFSVNWEIFKLAYSLVYEQLNLTRDTFTTVSPNEAVDSLPSNTSTGAWFFRRPKGQFKAPALARVFDIISNWKFEDLSRSCVAVIAWRTQERQSGTKFRQIFVMPFEFNICEAMFAAPIFKHFYANRDTCYCFDTTWSDNARTWGTLQAYKHIISIDYKQFDNHCSKEAIYNGMNFTKSLFQLNEWQNTLFNNLVYVHLRCSIVSNYHDAPHLFQKSSGLLSGSVFTNFLGSVINLLYINYTLIKMGYDPRDFLIKVKGDDVIIGSNVPIDMNEFITIQKLSFGSIILSESVRFYKPGEPIFFLGYFFTNKVKFASTEDLLHRKIAISGRFIPEEEMPENVRIISKIVSVLSNVSNGMEIFIRVYRDRYLQYYGMTALPNYYFDLAETEIQSYSTGNRKSVMQELTNGWMYR